MNKSDKYDLFLKLTDRQSLCSTPLQNICDQKLKPHPTILNGFRNKNLESYKVLCSPSKIFQNTDRTQAVSTEKRNQVYEATERKQQIEKNSIRTVNPGTETCASSGSYKKIQPRRKTASIESCYKEPNRILKPCKQKSQDFNHRINLPISKMQVNDVVENTYGFDYLTHKTSQSIKIQIDLQSQMQSDECYQIYTERCQGQNYKENYKHLLTSYQRKASEMKYGKKIYEKSQSIYQETKEDTKDVVVKPYNKIFKESISQYETLRSQKKAVSSCHKNQQESNFKIY